MRYSAAALNSGRISTLVSEFANDVGNVSSTALEEVFQVQFASDDMYGYLDGTTSQKMDTLNFARDVLSLGVDHVTTSTVEDLVNRILEGKLSLASDDKVFVPAIGALVALDQESTSLRSTVLGKVEEFVTMLGTHHNAAKPTIAEILLNTLDDPSSGAKAEYAPAHHPPERGRCWPHRRIDQRADLQANRPTPGLACHQRAPR